MSEVEKLKKRIEELKKQNNQIRKDLIIAQESIRTKDSILGKNLIPDSDYETLKGFFQLHDKDKSGTIPLEDLADLYITLDEPLTKEELDIVKLNVKKTNGKYVSLNDFVVYHVKSHVEMAKKKSTAHRTFKMVGGDLDTEKVKVKDITAKGVGIIRTLGYRVRFFANKKQISPWHDIPLYALGYGKNAKILNFVCEIPKWTRAKYEISTRELFNPIKQDVKNGKLRNYKHGDMMFNYGAFPQTWEDPKHISKETNCPGDNDPIDALEIGTVQLKTGQIAPVKVLGVLAMIDDNETDWKVITIQISDPLAHKLNDVDDVEKHIPGAIHAIREYLRTYKVCTGKKPNKFGFDGKCMGRDFALKVIEETHNFWKKLRNANKDVVHTPIKPKKFDWDNFKG